MITPEKSPWPDFMGNPIHHGDTLAHTDGTEFIAVKLPGYINESDAWRGIYNGSAMDSTPPVVSRLCLQIGEKGRAVVIKSMAPTAPTDNDLINAFSDAAMQATHITFALRSLFDQRRNAFINEAIVGEIREAAGLKGLPGDIVEHVRELRRNTETSYVFTKSEVAEAHQCLTTHARSLSDDIIDNMRDALLALADED